MNIEMQLAIDTSLLLNYSYMIYLTILLSHIFFYNKKPSAQVIISNKIVIRDKFEI